MMDVTVRCVAPIGEVTRNRSVLPLRHWDANSNGFVGDHAVCCPLYLVERQFVETVFLSLL